MDLSGIRGLLRHELVQYAANKKQLAALVIEILVVFVGLGTLFAAIVVESELVDAGGPDLPKEGFPGHSNEAVSLVEAGGIVLPFVMLMICGIRPVFLGATAVVGEKEHRTLESLLLLPVSDREILLGKVVPAALLPLVSCWLCCGIAASVAFLLLPSQSVSVLLNRELAMTVLLTAPAVAAMSALWATIPSVLVADTKAAQEFCVMPAMGIMVGVLLLYAKCVILEHQSVLIVTLCVLALDVLLFSIAVRLFNRERLLLRY